MNERIVDWTAAELSAAIRRRSVSCVEVMAAFLDQIEAINPRVNALVALRPRHELISEAATYDGMLNDGHRLGWMHGFPFAVKDLADVRGLPTTYGLLDPSESMARRDADSLFVARIRSAGAIFIGKTNTPELGLGSQTYNAVFGTTGNAYDPSRTSGGSSGGAAVAVATHMLPVADGSDFMGSLRNPPGWNNVLGLRPSFGRVPAAGDEVFVDQGGVVGPIARTAEDLGLLLQTMAGYDQRAPLSLETDPAVFGSLRGGSLRGRTVAWLGDLGGYLPMEDAVMAVTEGALTHFERLGMTVTALSELPRGEGFRGTDDLWPTWLTYRHWLAGMSVRTAYDLGLRDRLKPEAHYEYDGLAGDVDGGPIDAVDIYRASQRRTALYHAFVDLFASFDYVVLPTAQVMPFDAATHWPATVAGVEMSSYHRWMEVTTVATLVGAPTIAIPAGFDDRGLPIGLQVLGRNHAELELLHLAQAWEAHTRLVGSHPSPLIRPSA